MGGELGPEVVEFGASFFFEAGGEFVAELLIGPVAAGEADDGVFAGEVAASGEVIECGDELAMGEVAGRAEEDDGAGVGDAGPGQGLPQGVGFRRGGCLGHPRFPVSGGWSMVGGSMESVRGVVEEDQEKGG